MAVVFRVSQKSCLHSFSPKSSSTQSSSHHQFYSIIMEKSSNHQLLNAKISISNFPKFSISPAIKAQIHQIISKFKPNLQSTGKHNPPPIQMERIPSSTVQYSQAKYRLFSHVQSRRIYWDSFHMIDGAKPAIEGVNHNIDGAKCQVVKYFVVLSSQIQCIFV